MSGFGMDGSHGFASNLWEMLNDGGVWGVPRCGLIFRKDEAAKQFTLIERMPWDPEMPCSEEELLDAQNYDIEGIAAMFASIGIIVQEIAL